MRQNKALAEDAKKERNAQPQVMYVKPHPSPDADLTLPGTTQAIEDAVISARTTGYISKRYVDIGSRVKAGQLLAEIAAPDVEASVRQAQQQTQQAIAGVRQAESDVANKQATRVRSISPTSSRRRPMWSSPAPIWPMRRPSRRRRRRSWGRPGAAVPAGADSRHQEGGSGTVPDAIGSGLPLPSTAIRLC